MVGEDAGALEGTAALEGTKTGAATLNWVVAGTVLIPDWAPRSLPYISVVKSLISSGWWSSAKASFGVAGSGICWVEDMMDS